MFLFCKQTGKMVQAAFEEFFSFLSREFDISAIDEVRGVSMDGSLVAQKF